MDEETGRRDMTEEGKRRRDFGEGWMSRVTLLFKSLQTHSAASQCPVILTVFRAVLLPQMKDERHE